MSTHQRSLGSLAAIALIAVALMYSGHDQLNDEQKSAEVLSNAKHLAALDAAERRRVEKVLAAVVNEMPADLTYPVKK